MTLSRRQLFKLGGAGLTAACVPLPSSTSAANPASPGLPALLHLVQELNTSGARAMTAFELDAKIYLAIPQLAQDIDGQAAHMNGGDSDVSLILYQHQGSGFVEYQRLPVSGGEDAEFFRIGDRAFLATASIRSGRGPYSYDVNSTIFEWREGRFEPFQAVPTFAAKQWRHFRIGERNFLALAQNVSLPNLDAKNPRDSTILEWDGRAFTRFQSIPSAWGYNWRHFSISKDHFLAYADHILPSVIFRWNGSAFEPFQTLEGKGGRAFLFFEADGQSFLAFAKILGETLVYRWDGTSFVEHQILSGPGGREFAYLEHKGERYVIQVNFITGTPANPNTALQSVIYRLEAGQLKVVGTFPTAGATDAATFSSGNQAFVAIAESLTKDVRFRTPSRIYRFGTE
jgi:EPTP domain